MSINPVKINCKNSSLFIKFKRKLLIKLSIAMNRRLIKKR